MTGEQAPGGKSPSEKIKDVTGALSLEEFQKLKVGDTFWIFRKSLLPGESEESRIVGPLKMFSIEEGTLTVISFTKGNATYPTARFLVKTLLEENNVFLTEEDARRGN